MRSAALLLPILLLAGCHCPHAHRSAKASGHTGDVTSILADRLPRLGHRNWVVIADSAYPAQSNPSIETIYVGGEHVAAVRAALAAVAAAKHVRPMVRMDLEYADVPESDAPGIDALRGELDAALADSAIDFVKHEDLIAELDRAAGLFDVLILKTDCVLPYTSVFLQLDCGYWSGPAEMRLREALNR